MAATPPPIIFKITDAGKNAALNGVDAGLSLNLAHLAIGSGKRAITGAETALKAEISRHPVISGDVETDSHTLRFSSTITASSITQVFELGLVTDDNVLFAVASTTSNEPLITIHPDISFVGSFGLALDDVDAGSVTVTTDPNGALSLVIMENHLAMPDPHPQYLTDVAHASYVLEHHSSAKDPHTQYLKGSEFNAFKTDHLDSGKDPHTQYLKESEFATFKNTHLDSSKNPHSQYALQSDLALILQDIEDRLASLEDAAANGNLPGGVKGRLDYSFSGRGPIGGSTTPSAGIFDISMASSSSGEMLLMPESRLQGSKLDNYSLLQGGEWLTMSYPPGFNPDIHSVRSNAREFGPLENGTGVRFKLDYTVESFDEGEVRRTVSAQYYFEVFVL